MGLKEALEPKMDRDEEHYLITITKGNVRMSYDKQNFIPFDYRAYRMIDKDGSHYIICFFVTLPQEKDGEMLRKIREKLKNLQLKYHGVVPSGEVK